MIKIIRGAIVIFLFGIFGIGALLIRYLILPFKKNELDKYEMLQKSWQFFIWLLKKLKIIELEINDIERIKNIKNSIIVSTHPSFIDVVILMALIPHSTCFVAEKLSRNLFFKGMVSLLFILDDSDINEWLSDSCKKLDKGLNVIIFPMGRRHSRNDYPKIRRGAALMAQESHKNIVMLDLRTSYDFLQINQPIYEAGSEPVKYTLNYLGEINVSKYLEKYPDDVSFKTQITKYITNVLYK